MPQMGLIKPAASNTPAADLRPRRLQLAYPPPLSFPTHPLTAIVIALGAAAPARIAHAEAIAIFA